MTMGPHSSSDPGHPASDHPLSVILSSCLCVGSGGTCPGLRFRTFTVHGPSGVAESHERAAWENAPL